MPMSLKDEIYEQPRAIADLLASQAETVRSVARCVRDRNIRWVFLAARGTSDNAGLYAKYLWGAHNRLPVALAAPSLFSVYKTPPAVDDALVVAISQSGQSPDILGVVAEGRRQGALTLAITNDVGSPLAEEAQLVIDTTAGPETAVAATKTFTTQLVAIAMLSAALTEESEHQEWLARLPQLVEDALSLDDFIMPEELAYVVAEPYSPADFQHGPMALAHDGFPVLAVVLKGGDSENIIALLTSLVEKRKVELVAISNEATALNLANTPLELPEGLPEWVTPIPAIVPAQLFCYHLTRAKGFDTEDPRGLSKVTLTW
jgi:glucosamine--fructose-6-phosphate aminotransferase (isomerizing)